MSRETKESLRLMKEAFERAEKDPFFLAHDLKEFTERKNMSSEDLVDYLECFDHFSLLRLGFCRSISCQDEGFEEKIKKCAAYAGVSPEKLCEVIKLAKQKHWDVQ